MKSRVVNLDEAFSQFAAHWRPHIAATLNDYVIKLVKFKGDFVWHQHDGTDEMFLVYKGEMTLKFRDREVRLGAGDLYVIPAGVEHMTSAGSECQAILFEKAGTRNTGGVEDISRTAVDEPFIV